MKLSKEKRDRLIVVAVVGLMTAAGVWQLLIQPALTQLGKARGLGAKALEKFEEANTVLQNGPALAAEAERLASRIAELEVGLAHPTDPYSWSYQLIEQAKAGHEVEVTEVTRPQAPAPLQLMPDFPYPAVKFGVQGRAYYEELGRFLADFENRHPFFMTQNLELTSARQLDPAAAPGAVATPVSPSEKLSFRFEVVALVRPNP